MNINERVEFWKQHANKALVNEINNMNQEQIEEAFTNSLEFGTAGIRGVIGPGTNRMNIYNVIKPTYGYAKFLKEKFNNQPITVVVGTDNRNMREEFSRAATDVLTSFGINVYKTLIVPTPFISFAIRHLKAQGGVIITASHNPADNNGYKVYNEKGAQLLPHEAERIAQFSEEREEFLTYEFNKNDSLVKPIPQYVFDKYEEEVLKIGYEHNNKKDLKIVFSPQHGTSAKFIPVYLRKLGYEVIDVKEQMDHDPNFSGTPTPNPESPEAYKLGIEYAVRHNADIFITSDPDADRIGIAALKNGKFEILNGNQTAPILFDYIIKHEDLTNSYMAYSYVSTNLCEIMASKNGVESIQVATGFKWIGDLVDRFSDKKYIFGFEESYGSLINPNIARDKDSLQAAILIAEIANKAKAEGKSMWDLLEDVYKEYGFFQEDTSTKAFAGVNAINDRIAFMDNLRNNAKNMFEDNYNIVDLSNGKDLIAPMNLIRFSFKNGSWIAVRPSGTEPKIKFYKVATAPNKELLKAENEKLNNYIKVIMEGK